ncbi:hypothetical protein Tco_0820125 [Tanacetum coccineum]|uniref:Uncharacterized protein n=1 Tax=Tanacetum coccineum TaxID=301880 RepID=A0ABQ5A8K1_9ASTR
MRHLGLIRWLDQGKFRLEGLKMKRKKMKMTRSFANQKKFYNPLDIRSKQSELKRSLGFQNWYQSLVARDIKDSQGFCVLFVDKKKGFEAAVCFVAVYSKAAVCFMFKALTKKHQGTQGNSRFLRRRFILGVNSRLEVMLFRKSKACTGLMLLVVGLFEGFAELHNGLSLHNLAAKVNIMMVINGENDIKKGAVAGVFNKLRDGNLVSSNDKECLCSYHISNGLQHLEVTCSCLQRCDEDLSKSSKKQEGLKCKAGILQKMEDFEDSKRSP